MKHAFGTSIFLASFCLLATTAPGQITLTLETTSYTPGYGTHAQDTITDLAANSAGVSTAYGSGSATSTFGLMQLSSSSFATYQVGEGFGDTFTTTGSSQARWQDSILVTAAAPGLAGTGAWLHARFQTSGSLSVPGSINSTFSGAQPASAGWSVGAQPNTGFGGEGQVDGTRSIYIDFVGGEYVSIFLNDSPNFQVYDLYIPFTFGEAFNFQFTGSAQSFVQPRGMEVGASLATSANVTVTWLGIAAVLDENDNPLSGITIQSTGNWITASAIPEPSTYAALAGLAALGLAVWRRRRAA